MKYTIDADNKRLGRLASEIAQILQGKKSVYYNPRLASSDEVEVINLNKLNVSAKKHVQTKYFRHTGYMGHLKSKTLEQMFAKSPEKVLRMAVARMLPKNFLRARLMKKLTIVKS